MTNGGSRPTCFVVMPITTPPHLVASYGGDEDHFRHVYDHLFAPTINAAELDAVSPSAIGLGPGRRRRCGGAIPRAQHRHVSAVVRKDGQETLVESLRTYVNS